MSARDEIFWQAWVAQATPEEVVFARRFIAFAQTWWAGFEAAGGQVDFDRIMPVLVKSFVEIEGSRTGVAK